MFANQVRQLAESEDAVPAATVLNIALKVSHVCCGFEPVSHGMRRVCCGFEPVSHGMRRALRSCTRDTSVGTSARFVQRKTTSSFAHEELCLLV